MTTSPDPFDDPLAGARFPTTKWREGYSVEEVDAFIRSCESSLAARDGKVVAADIDEVRFTPVRLRAGYDMEEVDKRMQALRDALR